MTFMANTMTLNALLPKFTSYSLLYSQMVRLSYRKNSHEIMHQHEYVSLQGLKVVYLLGAFANEEDNELKY